MENELVNDRHNVPEHLTLFSHCSNRPMVQNEKQLSRSKVQTALFILERSSRLIGNTHRHRPTRPSFDTQIVHSLFISFDIQLITAERTEEISPLLHPARLHPRPLIRFCRSSDVDRRRSSRDLPRRRMLYDPCAPHRWWWCCFSDG